MAGFSLKFPVAILLLGYSLFFLVLGAIRSSEENSTVEAHQVARGPLHEALASPLPTYGPRRIIPHTPPQLADEPIPVFRPQGDPVWIPGYWFWDDETQSFLWVGGIWRYPPEGRHWIPGFWKVKNGGSTWYPGYWSVPQSEDTILPVPPPSRDPFVPPVSPEKDRVAYPGHWNWNGFQYLWQPGTLTRISPGFVWIPTYQAPVPGGIRIIPGYWDYDLSMRGLASCPSRLPPLANRAHPNLKVTISPAWFIRPEMVKPHLFIQTTTEHYLFGDYYSLLFQRISVYSSFEYSRNHLDPLFSLERALNRENKSWEGTTFRRHLALQNGEIPRPARDLTISETGEIPGNSLAAPPELVLSELKINGRNLDQAAGAVVLNQKNMFLAIVKDREQRDEGHFGRASSGSNLPQLQVDNSFTRIGKSGMPGMAAPGGLTNPHFSKLSDLSKNSPIQFNRYQSNPIQQTGATSPSAPPSIRPNPGNTSPLPPALIPQPK